MQNNTNYTAGLYLRLSKDDEQSGESVSIGTQRSILLDHCQQQGYTVYKVYVDDGYSGMNFNRPDFQNMLEDIEDGNINMVITKDLSRLGRDYIMTGYYSEIYFQMKGVRIFICACIIIRIRKFAPKPTGFTMICCIPMFCSRSRPLHAA